MLRAISLLLRHYLGEAERNRIFAEVAFPAEDDTREVHLSPGEIRRLLSACASLGYDELAVVVRLALQTSADRGVLLSGRHGGKEHRGLRVRDLRIWQDHESGTYTGEVHLRDSKTEGRSRSVPLTDGLCRELLALSKGKRPDDAVFSTSYLGLDLPWKRVRKAAALEHVRFKDLRAQISIYGEEASRRREPGRTERRGWRCPGGGGGSTILRNVTNGTNGTEIGELYRINRTSIKKGSDGYLRPVPGRGVAPCGVGT